MLSFACLSQEDLPAPQYEVVDLGTLGPKQFFGELGIFSDKVRSASVMCHSSKVEVLIMSKGDFLSRMPDSALEYFKGCKKYYHSEDAIVKHLSQQSKWKKFKESFVHAALTESIPPSEYQYR